MILTTPERKTAREIQADYRRQARRYRNGAPLPMAGGSPAAAVAPGSPGGVAAAGPVAQQAPTVPFDQASHKGLEPGPVFTVTPGAAQVTLGPVPLPAQGYLRRVIIEISGASGVAGTGAGDYPFNIINLLRLQDTNGAPLVELTGYNLFLCNTYGAYDGSPDDRTYFDYSASASNPALQIYAPIEIAPNGLGSLANQSAAAAYRLTLIVDTSANIWSVAPTTIPTLTIRTFMDFWTLPAPADMLQRPQSQAPPFSGVAQYWTNATNQAVASGLNQTRVGRVGNLIRTLIFVGRQSGARAEAPFPDPFTLNWDARDLQIASAKTQRMIMREYISQITARDTGVYAFIFSYGEDRNAGALQINSWLPTVTATRLEVDGTSAGAGTLDTVINDISVAETSPAARAVEASATGYHPPVAPMTLGAQ